MSKNTAKTFVLLAALGGLFIVIGGAFGGRGGASIGLIFGLIMVGASYWFSDKMAIASAKAKPLAESDAPELYAMVGDICSRANLPMPRLYITPAEQPNAFATGRNPSHAAVAVTQGLLRQLSAVEVKGVLAHEMSHVRNRDILIGSVAAAVAMGITFAARMAMWGAMFGGGGGRDDDRPNPITMLAMVILAPIAAQVIQMAVSRSREYEADRSAARILGTGEPLAQALEKLQRGVSAIPANVNPAQASAYIANPLSGRQQFSKLFSTHPPMEERIARLRSGEWAN